MLIPSIILNQELILSKLAGWRMLLVIFPFDEKKAFPHKVLNKYIRKIG